MTICQPEMTSLFRPLYSSCLTTPPGGLFWITSRFNLCVKVSFYRFLVDLIEFS